MRFDASIWRLLVFITITQAARMAGRDPRTVRQWVLRGDVPNLGVKIGGQLYVRQPVLERLLDGPQERDRIAVPTEVGS